MITRAYQNSKGERQEVAMTVAEWEAITEDQLQDMLGFKAPVSSPVITAPAPAAKPKAKGK